LPRFAAFCACPPRDIPPSAFASAGDQRRQGVEVDVGAPKRARRPACWRPADRRRSPKPRRRARASRAPLSALRSPFPQPGAKPAGSKSTNRTDPADTLCAADVAFAQAAVRSVRVSPRCGARRRSRTRRKQAENVSLVCSLAASRRRDISKRPLATDSTVGRLGLFRRQGPRQSRRLDRYIPNGI
jgi:hypothetical protein